MLHLASLPKHILLYNICTFLPLQSLLFLGFTSRFFYYLTLDEDLWKRRLEGDYNFSSSDTARSTGWKFLYKQIRRSKLYVWGEGSNCRLGVPQTQIPHTSIADSGVPHPIVLNIPGARIVSLVAGGMSFHAIDSKGDVYIWGMLDGDDFAPAQDGFSAPAQMARQPLKLKLPRAIRSISCARIFSSALDSNSDVWTFTSWGRPFRLLSPLVDKSSPSKTPIQVECGWGFVSILTQSGDVLVYWPSNGKLFEHLVEKNERLDELGDHTKAKPAPHEPGVIPCYIWDMQAVSPVKLSPIPNHILPSLSGCDSPESIRSETKLIRISGMDNNLVGLTNKGHVLRFNMLNNESTYQHGRWEYLPYFSEVEKVQRNKVFSKENQAYLEPPSSMKITHISGHFKTFVAYSAGPQSIVLMGKLDTEATTLDHFLPIEPIIIPSLQYQSVISVSLGDYHYGALTSTGKLLTWGSFSKGALGLGDPVNIEPGKPGGFRSEDERKAVMDAQGWMPFDPSEVQVPSEVSFDYDEKGQKEKYCLTMTAGGWHMGAIVLDLEPGDKQESYPKRSMHQQNISSRSEKPNNKQQLATRSPTSSNINGVVKSSHKGSPDRKKRSLELEHSDPRKGCCHCMQCCIM